MAAVRWNLDAERELWAAICAPESWHNEAGEVDTHPDSLYWFVTIAWGAEWYFRSTGKPRWLTYRVHGPYLQWLQSHRLDWLRNRGKGKTYRVQIASIIPRAFGKTITSTKCVPLWTHLRHPDLASVIMGEDKELSQGFLAAQKVVLEGKDENAWFAWLYGNWRNPDRDWGKTTITHGARRAMALTEPSIAAVSVVTGITGLHPDDAWTDDPLSANKLRESGGHLESAITAQEAIYPALATDGWMALVLTRYRDDDVAGTFILDEGVASWSGMPPPNQTYFDKIPEGKGVWHVYFLQAEDENGKAVLPEVMDEAEIARAKARDPVSFASQYMNDPASGEHMPLSEDQIEAIKVDRDEARRLPIAFATIHIDTAFKDEATLEKGDYSVISVWLHDARPNGLVYFWKAPLSNAWRDEHFMKELVKVMVECRRMGWHVRCITDEREMGGHRGLFKGRIVATLRGAGLPVPEIKQFARQGRNKIARIRTAAGYWATGYVRLLVPRAGERWLNDQVPGLKELTNQMLKVGKTKYDDVADASSDVFAEGVWIRPTFEAAGSAPDTGLPVVQPGDEALKAFSRKPTAEEIREIYDRQHAELYLADDPDWLPPR